MSDATTTAANTVDPTQTAAPITATSGVNEVWAKDWIQPDFTLNHKALDRLPEHLKDMRPTLEKYKGFEDVLLGYKNQQVMAGKKALAPLMPDAKPEVIAERKALLDSINGVPKEAKEYGITRPQDFPEAQWNQPMADNYAKWAHENSVSPTAAKKLMALQMESVRGAMVEQDKYVQKFYADEDGKFSATIQRENIPADRASSLIEKGALALGLDIQNEQTKNFLKGSDARLMAMRHAIAIGEDKAVTPEGGGQTGGGDPTELAKSATSDPSNPIYAPYWNKEGKYSRSAQEAAVAKVNGWYQQAAGKTKK